MAGDDDDPIHAVPALVGRLNAIVRQLEASFPGRKFTLDGHLVGSVGEVVAAYMFDLQLLAGSTAGHDAKARDGRLVQVKLTQTKRVALSSKPDYLIVMTMTRDGHFDVVYNGPGEQAWNACGRMGKNGQQPLSLARLRGLSATVEETQRLTPVRQWAAPKAIASLIMNADEAEPVAS